MSKPVIPARPTTYKGIKMRSRLEADYASALDRDGETWEYEPGCFGGPEGQWLPDFRIGFDGILVEIKPVYLLEWDTKEIFDVYDRVDKILRQMTVAWLSEPDTTLNLIFWAYGKDQVDAPLSLMGSRRHPAWLAHVPSMLDVPLVWPGMNQLGAVITAPGREWPS